MVQERLQGSQNGLAAAVALILVAFANPSLYGSAFLLLSLVWAIFFIPSLHKRRVVEISKSLWGFACALSAVALVLQIGVQLAYAAAIPGILRPGVVKALEILGFPVIASPIDFITIVGPLALALVLAAHQAGAAARRAATLSRHAAEGLELHTLESRQQLAIRVSSFTNAGVVVAVALSVAALAVPTLLAAPYLLVIAIALHRWAHGVHLTNVLDSGTAVTLQAYAAAHLSVLYIWQWALSYASWLQPVGDVLGLYVLANATGVEIWLEVAQFIALAALILSLGYRLRGGRGGGRAPRGLTVIARLLNVEHPHLGASEREPLLTEIVERDADDGHSLREPSSGRIPWAKSLLPATFEICMAAFEAGCANAGTVAGALCLLATIHTSAIGGVILATGLALIMFSGARRLPRSLGHALLPVVLLWAATCYIATSLKEVMSVGDILDVLGVHIFSTGAPMAAMILVAAGVAANLRSSGGAFTPTIGPSEEAWSVLQRHCIHFIDAAGLMILPVAVFAVGISNYSIIHSGFLVAALVPALRAALPLLPHFNLIAPKQKQHRILRIYAAIVLCAMYLVCLDDVFGHVLQPEGAQHILQLLGLWHVTVIDMLPIIGVLLLASLHAAVNAAALVVPSVTSSSPSPMHPPLVADVPTWRSAWVIYISRIVSGYGAAFIAATVYAVVLLDCDVSAVGLIYLALAAVLLAMQPKKGQWQCRNLEWIHHVMLGAESEGIYSNRRAILVDSPVIRWVPTTALAVVAALDLLTQAVLPAIVALDTAHCLPAGVLDFLRDAIGIDAGASGSDLAMWLIRPGVILGALALYRGLYCLGILHRQLQMEVLDEDTIERRRLAKQWGITAFLKRLVILHASKVVALLAFAVAMQTPSGLGWAIVVGLVLFPPFMGPHSSGTVRHHGSLRTRLALTQIVASLWMLAQYAALVPWVKDALAPYTFVIDLLAWIGVDTSAPSTVISLESLLRLKALLLVAVALKLRSLRWWCKLPSDVKDAASCGAACPLFWPPAPEYPRVDDIGTSLSSQQQSQTLGSGGGSGALGAARMALVSAAGRARAIAHQALEAVDWPSSPRTESSHPDDVIDNNEAPEGSTPQQASTPPSPDMTPLHQLAAFRFALQAWVERSFAEWGLEAGLLALLIAAFLSANALSLIYMALVGIGMAASPNVRRRLWHWVAVPTLAAALVWQYGQLVGLFPSQDALTWAPDSKADLRIWLGLGGTDPVAVWALFIAFAATVLQVHYDTWQQCAQNTTTAHEGLAAPLLTRNQAHPSRGGAVWAPLTYAAQSTWQWHDWARYAAYRWYLDIVLVAVVALCTLDNDIVHAGYLALALFFFRARIALRSRRNALFFWLPAYNFAIMVVVLAYQAPFEDFWDWSLDEGKSCTLAHLLGLYKLRPASSGGDFPPPRKSLLSWGYQGAATDLVLWGFIRLQAHMFASDTYGEVVAVVQSEEEVERAARKADIAAWKDRQAAAAASESRHRAARALRISRIKEGVDRSLGKFGAGINPTGLDYAFLEGSEHVENIPAPEGSDIQGPNGISSETGQPSIVRRRTTPSRRDTAYEGEPHVPSLANDLPSTQLLTDYEHQVAAASQAELASAAMQTSRAEVPPATTTTAPHPPWTSKMHSWVTSRLRRADRRESALAYALFVVAYLSDMSLLTLVLPVSAFVYALVAPRPARAYWQAILLYCETLIVASYAFQVPSRLACGFITPSMEYTAEMLGIHSNAARCIPLFLVYLATLTHTYSLVSRHEAGRRVAAAAEAEDASTRPRSNGGSRMATKAQESNTDLETGPGEISSSDASVEEAPLPALPTTSQDGVRPGALTAEFLLGALTVCESPPSFIIVEVDSTSRNNRQLEPALQSRFDAWRAFDLEAARRRRQRQDEEQNEEHSSNDAESWHAVLLSGGSVMQQTGETHHTSGKAPDLAKMGPLKLRFHSILNENNAGPSKELQDKNHTAVHTRALFEVIPLPATPSNSPGISSAPGWPLRSLHPAADAAATLLRGTPEVSSVGEGAGAAEFSLKVMSTEAHSRQANDLYAVTSSLDMLAFIFVALYYNKMVEAAGSLSDITSQHVVPLGYLLTLMVLFAFVVLDRVVYTLGSPAGKAVLHLGEMALYFWYCSTLVWGDPLATSLPPLGHLRILLFLKCCSFALGALQLRSGYPPPASYSNGMGRHTFVFMRSVSVPASLAFHVFTAVPFLYEMRQLLDWSCTPTTLTLYDWLKLEDINMSLYFSAVMRKSKAGRPLGTRQPRYLKIFQGALLFTALLLLLWVPLLVFSTGNPTYTVPSMVAFSVNVTLEASVPTPSPSSATLKGSPGPQCSKLRSQLYQGGERGAWVPWAGSNDTLPTALAVNYVPPQLQLMCTPADADSVWGASSPAQSALEDALANTGASVAVSFGWSVLRDLPPPSDHGGPLCQGSTAVEVAWPSRDALLSMLRGEESVAPLLRVDKDGNATSALFPAFWLLRGDACEARQLESGDLPGAERLPGRRQRPDFSWADRWLACNASLEGRSQNQGAAAGAWWRLECDIVDSQGIPVLDSPDQPDEGRAACGPSFTGPQLIAILDRVQGGIIGATLTKFGVIGLYSVFVYGIGRFLRLAVTNLRMRIMYEDLPTTRRLVALCQDVYLARAEGLLELEEELYGALLAVYRLPSVLYELSKKRR